jgi:hypothetical protein
MLHMLKPRTHSSGNNNSSNSSRNSLKTCVAKAANIVTGNKSQSQSTLPAAANPANPEETDTGKKAAEDNSHAYRQLHGTQQKSWKPKVLPANAYGVHLPTPRRVSGLNTREEVTPRHC